MYVVCCTHACTRIFMYAHCTVIHICMLFSHTADLPAIFISCSDNKYQWDIAVCGSLNYTCHDSSENTSVCQHYNDHQRISGLQTARKLQFFDGSLSLRLSGGDKCSNEHSRSTLINFECDRTVLIGEPRYIQVCTCTCIKPPSCTVCINP